MTQKKIITTTQIIADGSVEEGQFEWATKPNYRVIGVRMAPALRRFDLYRLVYWANNVDITNEISQTLIDQVNPLHIVIMPHFIAEESKSLVETMLTIAFDQNYFTDYEQAGWKHIRLTQFVEESWINDVLPQFLETHGGIMQKWPAVYQYIRAGKKYELFSTSFKKYPIHPLFNKVILNDSDNTVWKLHSKRFPIPVDGVSQILLKEELYVKNQFVLSLPNADNEEEEMEKSLKEIFKLFRMSEVNSDKQHIDTWHTNKITMQKIIRSIFEVLNYDKISCNESILHYMFSWISNYPSDFQNLPKYVLKSVRTIMKLLIQKLGSPIDKENAVMLFCHVKYNSLSHTSL